MPVRQLARATRRATAAIATAAVMVTGLVVAPALPATAAAGTVTGTVFLDINGDGIYQPTGTPVERLFAGVTVKAFDTTSATVPVATTVSGSTGAYTLTLTGTASSKLRIEFELSADQEAQGYQHSRAVLAAAVPGGQVASGSSVQFVDLAAPVHTASFGVSHPDDYNTGTADLLVPVHNPGNPTLRSGQGDRGLVEVDYSATGNAKGDQTTISSATSGVGSLGAAQGVVWGNAYQRSTGDAFTSAFLRRFGGLGEANLGGLYKTDVAAKTTQAWLDLESKGINVGGGVLDTALGLSAVTPATAAQRNAARGLVANSGQAIHDAAVFGLVGKVGLGATVIDDTTNTLYVANLFNRTIVKVAINADGTPGAVSEIAVAGLDADERIFGLHLYHNTLYVGVTATAENPANSGARADLGARVLAAPTSDLTTWSTRLAITDLTFQRGMPDWSYEAGGTGAGQALWNTTKRTNASHWNAWSDDWSSGTATDLAGAGKTCLRSSNSAETNRWYCAYPQPILSSIDFDSAGNMLVGFADRFSFQHGDYNFSTVTADTNNLYMTFAMGDVYVAGQTTTGAAPTYALESAGTVTSVTGTKTASWTDTNPGISTPGNAATNNQQGPGGGEFFYDRNRPSMTDPNRAATHFETTLGALATLTGVKEIPSTAYSTQGSRDVDFFGSGVKWLNDTTGATDRAYDVTTRSDVTGGGPLGWPPRAFGKAGGLGDLQFLVTAAPVQIGNYVWFDADKDGVQGPDEPALAGVSVNLIQNGAVIGTRTTDANGQYYFSSTDPDITGKLVADGGDYTLAFVAPTTGTVNLPGAPGTPWTSLKLTTPLVGSTLTDSNPDPATGRHTFTVGGPGENNHSYDAGYVLRDGGLTVTKTVTGSGAGAVPDDFEFSVGYSYGTPTVTGVLTVSKANPAASLSGLTTGTVVTLSEVAPGDAGASVGWGTPVFSGTGVTVNPNGSANVTIGDGTSVAVALENPTTLLTGGFAVTKSVTGGAAGAVADDVEFTVDYSYGTPAVTGSLVVSKDAPTDGLSGLPAGTVVTLSEVAPGDAGASVGWGTPVFSGSGVTVNPNGSASVTIGDGTSVAVALTNPTTLLTGGFEVTKSVTGGAADAVADDFEFTVNYSYGTPTVTGFLTVSKGDPTDALDGLPAGTVVTLSEVAPGDAGPSVEWGTPVFSGTGVTVAPDGSATFTIGDATTVAIGLENPTTLLTGGFEVTKSVTGGAADAVPDDFEFTVNYSYGTPAVTGFLTVSKGDPTDALSGLPAGTVVTLTEAPRIGADPSVGWGTPVFTGTGVTDNLNGTATFTIGDGTTVAIGLENPTTLITQGFSVTKVVSGTGAGAIPDDFEFAVTYSYGPGPTTGTLQLTKANPSAALSGLPTGTVVTLTESAPGDAGSNVEWGTPVFSGTGVTVHPDGSATFTIDDDTAVAVVLTNPITQLLGGLEVAKEITGGAAGQLNGWTVDVDYSYGAVPTTGTLSLSEATPSDGLQDLPAGTVVTLSEGAVTGAPAGAVWGTAVWTVDGVPVTASGTGEITVTIGPDTDVAVLLQNPIENPEVSIIKGDSGDLGTGSTVVNDADTMADGQLYEPGETRTIVFSPTNTGTEALVDVVVTDSTVAGADVSAMQCLFPGASGYTAGVQGAGGGWTVTWAESSSALADPETWATTVTFSCDATLTLTAASQPHVNTGAISGTGVASGTTVTAENPYNAFTAAIQVIKYDGKLPDPAVKDGMGAWIIPVKPLIDPAQDANDTDHSVLYPSGDAQPVRWVVTNTGPTFLTNVTLADITGAGPDVGAWVCDLAPVGGTAGYSFLDDGAWTGLFAPGESFFCEGPLTLPELTVHQDTVTVVGEVVVPEVDASGVPTGNPSLDPAGDPVVALDENGDPWTVTDDDPFNAHTVKDLVPDVSIVKGDAGSDRAGTTVVNDANTMDQGQFYSPGETRTIVFTPTNTGTEALVDVRVTDATISGGQVQALTCTFPGAASPTRGTLGGDGLWTVTWAQSASSLAAPATWLPTVSFGCTATLTISADQAPHVDTATVYGTGVGSGTVVTDEDPYNAFSAAIQVIKYDGDLPDPAVKDASGAWIVPAKPLIDAAQDANDAEHAVTYVAGAARTVRWVVTNTGSTYLTSLRLSDVTGTGPKVGAWTCDLSPVGGVAGYSFTASGSWTGLFAPGQSFFCEGPLTLGENATHQDTVTVVGAVVVPEVDKDGKPTGKPSLNADGTAKVALDRTGKPVTVTDDDPFNARTPSGLLAITGAELATLVAAALLAILLGASLVLIVRTRRASSSVRRAGSSGSR